MNGIADWLEKHSQPCFYKETFGHDCPGCGGQRSFIELLRGNIVESIIIYPALIPIILLIIFFFAHIIFKIKNGDEILKYFFRITVVIIFINYIYKILFCL